MADLRTNLAGIKSPNPFWLASAPPTNSGYQIMKAFDAGWGGAVWKTLGVEPVSDLEETRISLFCYENGAVRSLLDSLAQDGRSSRLLVPEGRIVPALSDWCGEKLQRGACIRRGNLTINVLPFVSQSMYDRLLWACDINFVRGEDSLVRALWAGRPFVWHAYVQQDDLHLIKLEALLERFLGSMPLKAAAAFGGMARAWNRQETVSTWLPAFRAQAVAIGAALEDWQEQIRLSGDLATNLVSFCKSKLK